MATKTECRRVVRHHLRIIEAVELPEMTRHRTDVEEDAVVQNLLRVDLIDDLGHRTRTRIETGTGIDHENILEEIDPDLDQEVGQDLETEGAAVVVIEAETDTEAEKAVDITEHSRTNRIHLKIISTQVCSSQLFLYNLMLLKMMVALWKCLKRCRNKCNQRRNRRLLF